LLSIPCDIKIVLSDYIIEIDGEDVTFGLIAITLRRMFERKYTHLIFFIGDIERRTRFLILHSFMTKL